MRKAQLFSLDAMIALVLVVLMLGTVTATSEGLRNEITSMVGWYERANIADNMLDVLTKSPGEPENWVDDPSRVRIVGLASNMSGGVSEKKVGALLRAVGRGVPAVKSSLEKMCGDKDFELLFLKGKWDFNVTYSWDPSLSGTGAGDFREWPGDCQVAGSERYDLDYPAVSKCDPLLVTGSLHVVDSQSFCVLGDLDGRGSVTYDIGRYPPATRREPNSGLDEPYLAIDGDWIIRGAVTVHVEGDAFINGALVVYGEGSRTVNIAGDLYIFGNSEHRPLFDPGNAFSISTGISGWSPGDLYIRYMGTWYVATGDPWNKASWYLWNGSSWVPVSDLDFNSIVLGTLIPSSKPQAVSVTINGYIPSSWQEPLPPCWNSGLPIEVNNVTSNYTFPTSVSPEISMGNVSEVSPEFYRVIVKINDTITTNLDFNSIVESRANSPWVEVAERRTFLSIRNYSREIVLLGSGIKRVISGKLMYPVPPYSLFEIETPNETGYSVFVIMDGNATKVLGVWRVGDSVGAALWEKSNGSVRLLGVYHGNSSSVLVPWNDVFSPFNPESGGKAVEIWLYTLTFSNVKLVDIGGIGGLLEPRAEPFSVKLWVWDDR